MLVSEIFVHGINETGVYRVCISFVLALTLNPRQHDVSVTKSLLLVEKKWNQNFYVPLGKPVSTTTARGCNAWGSAGEYFANTVATTAAGRGICANPTTHSVESATKIAVPCTAAAIARGATLSCATTISLFAKTHLDPTTFTKCAMAAARNTPVRRAIMIFAIATENSVVTPPAPLCATRVLISMKDDCARPFVNTITHLVAIF